MEVHARHPVFRVNGAVLFIVSDPVTWVHACAQCHGFIGTVSMQCILEALGERLVYGRWV